MWSWQSSWRLTMNMSSPPTTGPVTPEQWQVYHQETVAEGSGWAVAWPPKLLCADKIQPNPDNLNLILDFLLCNQDKLVDFLSKFHTNRSDDEQLIDSW